MADYLDPFAGYARGYRLGSQEERATQQGARTARQEDYAYHNYNPLKLAALKRADSYGEAALQPRIDALDPALHLLKNRAYTSDLGTGQKFAVATGNTGGVSDALHYYQGDDAVGGGHKYYLDSANYPRIYQEATLQNNQEVARARDAAAQQRAHAQLLRAYGYSSGGGTSLSDAAFATPPAPGATPANPPPTHSAQEQPLVPAPPPTYRNDYLAAINTDTSPAGAFPTPSDQMGHLNTLAGQVRQEMTQRGIGDFDQLPVGTQGQLVQHIAQSTGVAPDIVYRTLRYQPQQ